MARKGKRLLVLDEHISPVLVAELEARGREAYSVLSLDLPLDDRGDAAVLARLAEKFPSWVLVTLDDSMSRTWMPELKTYKVTLAVILSSRIRGPKYEECKRDLVHRFAHTFQLQEAGSIRQYDARGGRPWRWRVKGRVPKSPGYRVPPFR